MAIGRGSMTKELIGNRVKMDTSGGIVQARQPLAAAPSVGNIPPTPTNAVGGKPVVPPMKKGGKVRGAGCAKRGTTNAKMV